MTTARDRWRMWIDLFGSKDIQPSRIGQGSNWASPCRMLGGSQTSAKLPSCRTA